MSTIKIAKTVSIREAGHDEKWLQTKIFDNPECLGLGDLESISRERQQSAGGRLDMLLKDPTDNTMYEVEIQLGDTDESHIIRTIEYWDNEKRKWPKRSHYAVLVAESVTRRFFNVIQLLSHAVPIIAIQVNMIKSDEEKLLHFSKILDTYEEPEDTGVKTYTEKYWVKYASWVLKIANIFKEMVSDVLETEPLRYTKFYVAIACDGRNYFGFHKRTSPKSVVCFSITEAYHDEVSKLFDGANIAFIQRGNEFCATIDDNKAIEKNKDTWRQIAELMKKSCQK
jgi:hypothetical protein